MRKSISDFDKWFKRIWPTYRGTKSEVVIKSSIRAAWQAGQQAKGPMPIYKWDVSFIYADMPARCNRRVTCHVYDVSATGVRKQVEKLYSHILSYEYIRRANLRTALQDIQEFEAK